VNRFLAPALLGALLVAAGCGQDSPGTAESGPQPRREGAATQPAEGPTAGQTGGQAPTPTETVAPEEERTGGEDRKVSPPSFVAGRKDDARSHLLPAASLPLLAEGATWTVRSTGPERPRPVGACQKTPLTDIGALDTSRRLFLGPEESRTRARQVVAEFADGRSAWRAHEVLSAWRDDCEQRLEFPRKQVGPMEQVDLEHATGGHYRATFGTRREQRAAGFGIVRTGRWLSIVEIRSASEAYPTRWDPSQRVVQRIAATFG
jgi:hypothetical protein